MAENVTYAVSIIAGATLFFELGANIRLHPFLMAMLGSVFGFIGAFAWFYFVNRKGARMCPSCSSETLIPVASPEGKRIMKELGYVES